MQLLRATNGPRPRSVLTLIIQDDGSLDNPGQLVLDDFSGEALESQTIFYNGDSVYDVWVSPTGDLWACSSYGNIYTTADIQFPESPVTPRYNLDHERMQTSGFHWKMYCLDAVQNGVSIWSPDGVTIFVGTYSGHVYQWDGRTWSKHETPVSQQDGKYITHFAGSSSSDVYAIGSFSQELIHYNGKTWSRTAYDQQKHGRLAAKGILRTPDGAYYLACEGGRIWKTHDGQTFDLVAEHPELNFSSLIHALDQIILAAGEKGVYALRDGQLINIRNTFSAEMVAGGGAQAVFIRPATDEVDKVKLAYAIHTASETRPWWGYTFSFGK